MSWQACSFCATDCGLAGASDFLAADFFGPTWSSGLPPTVGGVAVAAGGGAASLAVPWASAAAGYRSASARMICLMSKGPNGRYQGGAPTGSDLPTVAIEIR